MRQLEWQIEPSLGLALLLAGAFLGATWEQRHVTDVVWELQNQVQQLQNLVKSLPSTVASSGPAKKIRKLFNPPFSQGSVSDLMQSAVQSVPLLYLSEY